MDAPAPGRRILVVDDRPVNRELLVTLLGHAGYAVIEAADGAEALRAVRDHSPDLVVCDILMPTMDGYEFVRELRTDPAIAHTPVVFCTAHYHEREAQKLAEACGVSHVLIKPVEPELVLRVVAEALGETTPSTPIPRGLEFDRQHLRLVTDKLSQKAEELQRANLRLAALIDLNLQIASELDPETLLSQVCRRARDLLGSRYSTLGARDKNGDWAVKYFASGIPREVAEGFAGFPIEQGVFSAVLKRGRTLRLREEAGSPLAEALPPGHPKVSALVIAPISSPSDCYGWICLGDKLGGAEFTDDDERLLTILGAQVGRVYENGSLYAGIRRHADRLQEEIVERKKQQVKVARLSRIQAVLSGINSAIVRIRERDELFAEACRIAVEHGALAMAWIGMVDPGATRIEPAASAGEGTDLLEVIRLSIRHDAPDGLGIIGLAVTSRAPVIVNDISQDPRVLHKAAQIERGFRAWVALPLLVHAKCVGVLALYSKEPGFFDDEEMKLLQELAGDVSFALEYLAKEEKLNYLAYYDALSGLANRTLLQDRLEQALHFAQRYEVEVAVLAVDLDRFKLINDTLGHGVGDEVLRLTAARLVECVREIDTVARVGGDEFVMVLAGVDDARDSAQRVAKRIVGAFAQPAMLDGKEVFVTCSIGVTVFPGDAHQGGSLLKNADVAMYRAKEQGGGCWQFYMPDSNEPTAERLSLEAGLRRALERDEFLLHYQPQVDLRTGEICEVEALIRWRRSESELVPPARFIPIAEETGLILPIGEWVLKTATAQLKAWHAAGLPAIPVGVNLSAHQFRQLELARRVRDTILQSGLHPKYVELELTESLLMRDVETAIRIMTDLRGIGVKIALDDFGTGYSSLSYLRKFPIDALKVDQSFVAEITSSVDGATIAEAIIAMAHSLGLSVVAEGVETAGQLAFLLARGCDRMQGYLFSRPLPPDQIEELLRAKHRLSLPFQEAARPDSPRTLLLVDDDAEVLAALTAELSGAGYQILTADRPSKAFEVMAVTPVQVVVSDQRMPEMAGAAFLGQVRDIYPRTARIMLSGYTELSAVTRAISDGAIHRFLAKPWDGNELRSEIDDAFRHAATFDAEASSGR